MGHRLTGAESTSVGRGVAGGDGLMEHKRKAFIELRMTKSYEPTGAEGATTNEAWLVATGRRVPMAQLLA